MLDPWTRPSIRYIIILLFCDSKIKFWNATRKYGMFYQRLCTNETMQGVTWKQTKSKDSIIPKYTAFILGQYSRPKIKFLLGKQSLDDPCWKLRKYRYMKLFLNNKSVHALFLGLPTLL